MPQTRAHDERPPKGRAGFITLISLLVVTLVTVVLFSVARVRFASRPARSLLHSLGIAR
jgi:Tfp pilus assembly protein PilX